MNDIDDVDDDVAHETCNFAPGERHSNTHSHISEAHPPRRHLLTQIECTFCICRIGMVGCLGVYDVYGTTSTSSTMHCIQKIDVIIVGGWIFACDLISVVHLFAGQQQMIHLLTFQHEFSGFIFRRIFNQSQARSTVMTDQHSEMIFWPDMEHDPIVVFPFQRIWNWSLVDFTRDEKNIF